MPKSDKFFFLGYPKEAKEYYFHNLSEGKIFFARTRGFLEKDFLFQKELVGAKKILNKFNNHKVVTRLWRNTSMKHNHFWKSNLVN